MLYTQKSTSEIRPPQTWDNILNRLWIVLKIAGNDRCCDVHMWGRVSLVARALNWQAEKVGSHLQHVPLSRHFIMHTSSVDRDVNGDHVGQNWLLQWFQTLNISFTFCRHLHYTYRLAENQRELSINQSNFKLFQITAWRTPAQILYLFENDHLSPRYLHIKRKRNQCIRLLWHNFYKIMIVPVAWRTVPATHDRCHLLRYNNLIDQVTSHNSGYIWDTKI